MPVISSPRKDSYSGQPGKGIVEKFQAAYPLSIVQVHDLAQHPFPHLEEVHIQPFKVIRQTPNGTFMKVPFGVLKGLNLP